MWPCGRLLPLMVGDCIPEKDCHWQCFVNLLRILCVGTAVEITPEAIDILQILIDDYLWQFNRLKPSSMTHKMHYSLHFPSQIYW